jgi:hypothetical protein
MRVLLDESVPHQLRAALAHHDAQTVVYAGFGGYKNGDLLKAAEQAAFDVLLTGDKTLYFEQNMAGRKLALVCLSANSWKIIKSKTREIVAAVDAVTPGSITRVECGAFVRVRKPPSGPQLG